jgi:hypothetical protein
MCYIYDMSGIMHFAPRNNAFTLKMWIKTANNDQIFHKKIIIRIIILEFDIVVALTS